ncbi:Spy/CpxP family protein refolding chaperone [Synechococcus sp. C9]|jgi:Spy/CpxP family protein refolding chaperone|uniref:Spy/CpxP family protein refolding chaperone n=1 Tax=Synechococcus sp. C9 TaxID=102119 RepID=UPI001FF0F274|nr:Spy/CpxP family protein refolding chaperone [Synechococcus sp. C9]
MKTAAKITPLALFLSLFFISGCNLFSEPEANTPPVSGSPGVTPSPGQEGDNPITLGTQGTERSGTDPLELFQNPQIKKELNITDEQSAKIKAIGEQFRQRARALVSGLNLGQMEPAEREKKLDQIKDELEKEVGIARDEVGKVLTPAQLKRFKEITLQIYGFGILSYEHFIQELKLTPEQQAKLKKLRDDTWTSMRINLKVPEKGADNKQIIATNRKRMDQILQESNAKALDILTPEQKKLVETLQGAKFQFTPPQPG